MIVTSLLVVVKQMIPYASLMIHSCTLLFPNDLFKYIIIVRQNSDLSIDSLSKTFGKIPM